jgi:hypothetical protein
MKHICTQKKFHKLNESKYMEILVDDTPVSVIVYRARYRTGNPEIFDIVGEFEVDAWGRIEIDTKIPRSALTEEYMTASWDRKKEIYMEFTKILYQANEDLIRDYVENDPSSMPEDPNPLSARWTRSRRQEP